MMRLLFLLLVLGSETSTPSITLFLLDGSKVVSSQVGVEMNMICCINDEDEKLLLSKALIDWKRTRISAPFLYESVYPEKAAKEAENDLADQNPSQRERRAIVITNEDLDALPPLEQQESLDRPKPKWAKDKEAQAKTAFASGPVIQQISRGDRVDVTRHLEPEKYVMFDFFADWCGPCRQLTPQLEAFVRRYPGKVALKKIDIIRWGTPVAQQYGIRSIPYVQLYDPRGRKVRDGNGFAILNHLNSLAQAEGW